MANTTLPWVSIDKIVRDDGVAGQYAYTVDVTYWHGGGTEAERDRNADPTTTVFVSSVYHAPVVMITSNGIQSLVCDWTRYGPVLNEDWVRRFYGLAPLGPQPLTDDERACVRCIRAIASAEIGSPPEYPFFWASYRTADDEEMDLRGPFDITESDADAALLRLFTAERANHGGDFETVLVMCHG